MTGRRPRAWLRGRSYVLGAQLDTFLVCAASAVVFNRTLLVVLGYPQIGGRGPDGIHISHSLYGPMAMMIAVALTIAFLHPSMRWVLAIVGGLGFGWWVDELGKYVSNAGYLFRPALALIYVVFVVMFLGFRSLAGRAYGPDDGVVNALASLQAAALGSLDTAQRAEALTRLDASGATGELAASVRDLLADAPASPPRPPGRLRRTRARLRTRYLALAATRGFTAGLEAFFAVLALGTLGVVVGLSLDGPGISRPPERIATVAAVVAAGLVVVGLTRLPRSRLAAYRWFDRALLIRILVVQVFLFREEQFAAVVGLGVDLLVWGMLRSAMRIEEQRARSRPPGGAGGVATP